MRYVDNMRRWRSLWRRYPGRMTLAVAVLAALWYFIEHPTL